jgi:hypothetical protein
MENSAPFVRFLNLLNAVDDFVIPLNLLNIYRVQYHFILGELCLAESEKRHMSVTDLMSCSILGSQPTAHKRIKELVQYQLIQSEIGFDKRLRYLTLTDLGHQHLRRCSELMQDAISQGLVIKQS